ncbi:hypothetical protein [Marinobacterium weihaiense]|uniref:Lipoprotein n=1 Tax=Marinobacterium weihaiense TaxID=2851016 RepID=A0ABS6MGS1_9GAMM|nr:hypothetical protein [Marinobacterium weihaiense]MBV0934907.1 hypothetical protein [Marinobacterium weihaiense]
MMKYKILSIIIIPFFIYGCTSLGKRWRISNHYDVASGSRTCSIVKGNIAFIGVSTKVGNSSSSRASVYPIESYGIYPRSSVYIHIAGKRWSGREKVIIDSELYSYMTSGGVMNISWSPWPQGGRRSAAIDLTGFKEVSSCIRSNLR